MFNVFYIFNTKKQLKSFPVNFILVVYLRLGFIVIIIFFFTIIYFGNVI